MEKKLVSAVAKVDVLALHAESATEFVVGNQKKKQNKRIRNDMEGNETEGKTKRKVFQIGNDLTSTNVDVEEFGCMKEASEQGKKTQRMHESCGNGSPTEPPSYNFIQERNICSATIQNTESGLQSSSSSDEVSGSWVRRQKCRKLKRDNPGEESMETENSKGITFSICSASQKDSPLLLPVNSCLKEDLEVNCNAPDVSPDICLSMDRNDAEKRYKKHVFAESIPTCHDHEATYITSCLQAKHGIENESQTEPPSDNFTPESNAFAVTTHDIRSGTCSNSSSNEVLCLSIRREKTRDQEKRDNSVERNKDTEKSEGTKSSTCSLSEEDILLQLPVNSCLKGGPEENCNALSFSLSRDKIGVEKQLEKHDLAESTEICEGLEAACSACYSNAGNICSAAESNEKPVICTMSIETYDDYASVSHSLESEILFTCERKKSIRSRQTKIFTESPTANAELIPDIASSLLLPNRKESPSLVQSVEAQPSFCSEHVEQKEFDEADVRIPLLELYALRDEVANNNYKKLLSQEGSLPGNSQKKLLVLDINGLLADVVYHVLEGYTPDTIISGKSVFKRPFCDDFLEFCLARFNVGVWSSRMRRNVELILDFLMGNAKHKLLFVWDQYHCTNSNFTTIENRKKPLLVKKLKKLWEKYEPSLPWELGEYNESNTLLLDDSPYKAVCNPPYTAVFPTTYRYTDKEDNSLGPGGELRMYLEGLALAENVQKYVEENPIGNRPITENSPSWRFYLEVIHACSSPESSPPRPTFHWKGYR